MPQEELTPEPPLPPAGQMPMLRMDELIGRRPALRRITGVLRDDERVTGSVGRRAGVLVRGIGGVGKSALAGRVMARLVARGWTALAVVGRWGLGELALTVGAQLAVHDDPALAPIGALLLNTELPDQVRIQQLQTLLANHRVLLVLDNFEDNLTLGGGEFLDEAAGLLLGALFQAARKGKILITCRYPVPGADAWVADEPLGPLSLAETRKLFYRLPALTGEAPETLGLILRHIGGHPRMLEYLDAILRQGQARLATVTHHLRENAKRLGLDPERLGGDLEQSLRDALRLGAEDVLLDQLIELVAGKPDDLAALHQCAAFALPVDVHGLAFALAGAREPAPAEVDAAHSSARRLIDTSLLTPLPDDQVWVHRWTAQELRLRLGEEQVRKCVRRAGEYRAWRAANVSHSLIDSVEAVRRFLEADAYDRAAETARPILVFMQSYGQLVDVAGFAAEVLETLPPNHQGYYVICGAEADALLALGATGRAMERYREVSDILQRLARAEPDRADYQRDLSVSFNKMGDLFKALGQGEDARAAFQKSLEIAERLARAEPERADFQWDLVLSLIRIAGFDEYEGAARLARGLMILRALDAAGSLYPQQRELLTQFEDALAGSA